MIFKKNKIDFLRFLKKRKKQMEQIKEAFLYLNCLVTDKFINDSDVKSMEEELIRRFIIMTSNEAKEIVILYFIARKNILRI
jgi:hypothetical protein